MDFFGSALSILELEERGLRIAPEHRAGEADLLHTRWWDYRLAHPVRLTYLYAHHYLMQTRRWAACFQDVQTADEVRAFTPDDVFMGREATPMWLARRCADKIGAPYDWVLQFVQPRALERKFHRFPRPNQLYGEDLAIDLAAAWKEWTATKLSYSRHPFYQAKNFSGHPLQLAHRDDLIAQIKRRAAPHQGLLAGTFAAGALTPQQVSEHFDSRTVERAIDQAALFG